LLPSPARSTTSFAPTTNRATHTRAAAYGSGNRLAEIPRDRDVILHCKGGGRSQRIVEFLAQQGYTSVKNLTGGITAWADQIDPRVQKY
jgi:rhodanese-related sulfurtransferase